MTTAGSIHRPEAPLAHLSPIFDLHLYRARNPSNVDWSAYDFIALIQLAVDTIALSSGLDGNLGAPRDVVLEEMARTAAAMAPHRPPGERTHAARHILDHLLRHDEPTPYFEVGYADPDGDWRPAIQQVRVLYETLASDGSTLHVNVDNTAVTLLLIATNRSLEDEHEAVIAVMQAQASSGRLGAAVDSAEDALVLSRAYAANVRRMIIEAERDVSRVDYLATLRPELSTSAAHLDRRMESGRGVGYLLKERVARPAELADAIRRVGEGGSVVDPEVVRAVLTTRRVTDPLGHLSSRERTVLELIAEGLSNQAIATRLLLTDRTVEAHVRSLLTKLDLPPDTGTHRRVLAVLAHLRVRMAAVET